MSDDPMNEDEEAQFLEGAPGEAVRDTIRADPVPPLDELTRRRLVSRALEEHVIGRPGRRGPWMLGAAAAAVLVLVGVVAVLANLDGDDTQSDRAVDATVADEERELDEDAAAPTEEEFADDAAEPGGAAESSAPIDLGDLGTFDDPEAALAALVEQAGAAGVADAQVPDFFRYSPLDPCRDALNSAESGIGTPVAVGTASIGDRPATLVVADRPNGVRVAVVVTADCEVFAEPL